VAGPGPAAAQAVADTSAQPYLLEARFYEVCDNPASAAQPALPTGWTAYPPPASSDTQVACGPGGIGVTGSSGDTKMFATLFRTDAQPLTRGRYVLTGAGAGTAAMLKNGFGDASFASRTRILNLKSAAPIVNSVEIDWDDRSESGWYGLLELWGTGIQWLRLEKLPAAPIAARTYGVPSSADSHWSVPAGTTWQAEGEGTRLSGAPGGLATLEQVIELPPGRYEVTTEAHGGTRLLLTSGPAAAHRYTLVDEEAGGTPDGAAVPVQARFTASGQPVVLSLAATQAGQDVVVFPVHIRPLVEAPVTAAQRAALRPSPWPARGMTVSDVFDLLPDTRPPRDAGGMECARIAKPWSSNTAWPHHADFADLKALGANLVRLPVPTMARATKPGCLLVDAGDVQPDGRVSGQVFWTQAWPVILEEAAAVVQAAGNAGLKVVLLMEPTTPGAALDEQPDGWASLQARKDFVRGWREMAARLSPLREHLWAYDLKNEPYEFVAGRGNVPPSRWRELAVDTIAAIRRAESAADPQREPAWVVYEPVLQPSAYWAPQYAGLVPLPDPRVVYSEHYYDDFAFTHQNICQAGYPQGSLPYAGTAQAVQGALQPLADFSLASGAPVLVGEFSAAVWAGWSPAAGGQWLPRTDAAGQPVHDNVNWLRDVLDTMEANGLAWTYHSYRTYFAWNAELIATHGPCGPFDYQAPGGPDTPTLQLLRSYLQANP
jgi:hypothetical protein